MQNWNVIYQKSIIYNLYKQIFRDTIERSVPTLASGHLKNRLNLPAAAAK